MEPYYPAGYDWQHSHRHQFEYLGLESIAQQLVFITDSDLQLNQGPFKACNIIRQAHRDTHRLPVLCLDLNPCDSQRYMQELESIMDPREYFVLSPDIRPDRSPCPNSAPWPSWLINQQIQNLDTDPPPREYRISMLSGSMRYHRLLLWRAVKDVVRDDDVVVINRMGNFASSLPGDLPDVRDIEQWQYELPWTNDLRHADHPDWGPWSSWQLPPDQGGNSHAAFRACVNITNETGPSPEGPMDQCLLSEKTWKAYLSGCLVVNYGAPGAAEFLASQGIEIWHLGNYGPLNIQIQHIQDIWKRDDIWQQHTDHIDAVQHNRTLVMSKDFAHKLAKDFLIKISDWI